MCLPPQNLISSLMASCLLVGPGDVICIICVCVCAPLSLCVYKYLFDHEADLPLLTLQHVVKVMNLFLQDGHLLLQICTPADI